MVNEERLQHMIKMAVFDTCEDKKCRPMEQYTRHDYVSLKLLGSFVAGSIGFVLLFGMWALYSMDSLMEQINTMDIPGFLTSVAVKYVLFLGFYLVVTYIVANGKYTSGRRKVKKYYNNVKKLNRIYEREDKLKMPDNKEWD